MTQKGEPGTASYTIDSKGTAKKLGWDEDVTSQPESPPEQSPEDSGDKSSGSGTTTNGKEASMTEAKPTTRGRAKKTAPPKVNGNTEPSEDAGEESQLEYSNWDHFTEEASKAAGRDGVGTALKATGLVVGGAVLSKVIGMTDLFKSGAAYVGNLLTGDESADADDEG